MHGASFRIYPIIWAARLLFVISQICLSFSSRILDRAGVVVLVSCKSSASCKGLLTICVRAFIGSCSRVDSTMPGKRTGIAERLNSFHVSRF